MRVSFERMTFEPDLDAYFARIHYGGSRAPTLATLHAIARLHVQHIPFENLDVLLGKGIEIEPERVQEKLVYAQRGGYCFEQNTHLMHVLRALGFEVTPLQGRVRIDRARDFTPPSTHVLLRVEVEGQSWLVDAGVGGLSLTSAIQLTYDIEQSTPHEPRRLVREGDWQGELRAPGARIFHQAFYAERWNDVCEFTLDPMPEIDRTIGNWYTSTHPASRFRSQVWVARATEKGRLSLLNRAFTTREGGRAETRTLGSPDELLEVLRDAFGLSFPNGTHFPCPDLDWT